MGTTQELLITSWQEKLRDQLGTGYVFRFKCLSTHQPCGYAARERTVAIAKVIRPLTSWLADLPQLLRPLPHYLHLPSKALDLSTHMALGLHSLDTQRETKTVGITLWGAYQVYNDPHVNLSKLQRHKYRNTTLLLEVTQTEDKRVELYVSLRRTSLRTTTSGIKDRLLFICYQYQNKQMATLGRVRFPHQKCGLTKISPETGTAALISEPTLTH